MTPARAVRAYWRKRTAATSAPSDRAYVLYLTALVSIVVVAPAVSAVWAFLRSDPVRQVFGSTSAQDVLAGAVLIFWIAALTAGRVRGPAALPSFLAYALGYSKLTGWQAFGAVTVRAIALLACGVTVLSAGVYFAAAEVAEASSSGVLQFAAAGAAVGIVGGSLWLLTEARPSATTPMVLALIVTWLGGLVWSPLALVLPWEWFGHVWVSGSWLHLLPLVVAAIVAAIAVPGIIAKLTTEQVIWQAQAWSTAVTHTATFDLSSLVELYRALPSRFRQLSALPAHPSMVLTFMRRDILGAVRGPGRLIVGVLQMTAGVLVQVAWLESVAAGVLGALLMVIGVGALTDGLRHAADVVAATGSPMYGISNSALIGLHVLAPTVALVAPTSVGVLMAVISGDPARALGMVLLVPLLLASIVAHLLRGDLPVALLTPVESPMGDLSSIIRLLWALELPVLVALSGAFASDLPHSSPGLVAVYAVVLFLLVRRWRLIR